MPSRRLTAVRTPAEAVARPREGHRTARVTLGLTGRVSLARRGAACLAESRLAPVLGGKSRDGCYQHSPAEEDQADGSCDVKGFLETPPGFALVLHRPL